MENSNTTTSNWTGVQKIAFRFLLIFFLLYIILNPNGVIPFSDEIAEYYLTPLHNFLIWAGANILHLSKPVEYTPTGSGDTTIDYLAVLFLSLISLIGMLIWSVLDWKKNSYTKLYYWLTVLIRYYAGITMITYGAVKIIKLQFPSPSLYRLLEPYGESSPMGLAWTFMGYSTGYNYFTGIAEFICGVLLFYRKTSRLGAVLLLVIAGNIMAINYCFDVPVKLLSTFLVLIALFLLSMNMQQFVNFFLLNKTALPANLLPHRFKKSWKNLTISIVKYVLITYVIGLNFCQTLKMEKIYGSLAPKPPLYGIYNVVYFIRNQDTIEPLATDTNRWKKVVIANKEKVRIQLANDTLRSFDYNNDVKKKTLEFVHQDVKIGNSVITYTEPKANFILFKGRWLRDSVEILLSKYDLNKFLLNNRGFH